MQVESEKKKLATLEVEKSSLREALADVTSKLEEEFRKRKEETEFLTRKLAEKTRAGEVDKQAVIDIHAKMELMKRQNQDLTKELAATKTKLDNQGGDHQHKHGRVQLEEQVDYTDNHYIP